jgi:hypothetical protein
MEGEEKKKELDVHTTTINQMNTTNVSIQCGDSLAKLENTTWKIEKHVLK